jgi:hypothetical protein
LVPWHLSIAIFGAFGMSLFVSAAKPRMPPDYAGLMIHLAFFWIALSLSDTNVVMVQAAEDGPRFDAPEAWTGRLMGASLFKDRCVRLRL